MVAGAEAHGRVTLVTADAVEARGVQNIRPELVRKDMPVAVLPLVGSRAEVVADAANWDKTRQAPLVTPCQGAVETDIYPICA